MLNTLYAFYNYTPWFFSANIIYYYVYFKYYKYIRYLRY